MGFGKEVKEKVLVASARHCCICHKSTGINIEVHHIQQAADGGNDTFENAIPLCFDCHSNVGHYNARHPKGTKFTISELQKHRDDWYRIVAEGSLDFLEEPRIVTNYLLVSDVKGVREILEGNMQHIKVENAFLYQNDILNFWKRLIGSNEYWSTNKFGKELEKIEQTRNHETRGMLTLIETPSKEEIIGVSPLIDYLISKAVDIEKYCKKYIVYENECEDATRTYYEFREFAFLFMALRNQSEDDLCLKECSFSEIKEFEFYSENSKMDKECIYSLPPVMLKTGMTVLVPCGILLKQFKSDEYKVVNISRDIGESCFDNTVNKYCDHASLLYSYTVGKTLIPRTIKLIVDGVKYTQKLRGLDLENLYLIDKDFRIGSCPHLELITDSCSTYLGELFSNVGVETSHLIVMPKDGKLRLHEIEDEVTYINNIKINGKTIISNVVLSKGETLEIECFKDEKIIFTGCYELLFEKENYIDDPIHKRWKLYIKKGVPFNILQNH